METFDVVIQLGSQVQFVDEQYRLAPHTQMRTDASAILLKAGIAKHLIISGGHNFGVRYGETLPFGHQHPSVKEPQFRFEDFANADEQKSEAQVIKDFLVRNFHFFPSQILTESLSATTIENARCVKMILDRRPTFTGQERLGLLTNLYHMKRALAIFREAGLTVEPIFAEDVLAKDDPKDIPMICKFYTVPRRDGVQYDVEQMRQLLTDGKSVGEMLWSWWYVTVVDGHICADGVPEDLERQRIDCIQARDKWDAILEFGKKYGDQINLNMIKGPFNNREQISASMALKKEFQLRGLPGDICITRDRRNPFGIAVDDEHFDERLTSARSEETGDSNMTEALEWLERWQKENLVKKPVMQPDSKE